jgi:hypothetical protein
MKKIILSAIAICAFGFANAQDMKFGVKGGLNSASIAGATGSSSKTTFHIGGLLEFKASDKFAIQPELVYSNQGCTYPGGGIDLTYINIPVMAKYYVAETFNIQAGPQIGLLMSAKLNGADYKELCNSTDFGLNLGAGYDLNENMMLDLRYNMGMSVINKDTAAGTYKNNVISVSFGYKF